MIAVRTLTPVEATVEVPCPNCGRAQFARVDGHIVNGRALPDSVEMGVRLCACKLDAEQLQCVELHAWDLFTFAFTKS